MEKTFGDLAKSVKLTFEHGARMAWGKQDEWRRNANSYRCTLHYQGRRYSFDFWQGTACTGDPTAEGCLECLLSDSIADAESFESWCSELGYYTDSRKAERTYKSCLVVAKNMKRLLGDDFEAFLCAER